MTNKNIAWTTVIGLAVFFVSVLADENNEGVLFYAGMLVFWFGVIYGLVRLFKSEL